MKTVEVRIREGYEGHRHKGELVAPGETIEVTPQQAAWLMQIGAAEPVKKTARGRRGTTLETDERADSQQEPETEENEPEGEDDTAPLSP